MSNLFFKLTDNCLNPLTNSKVTIRSYQPPTTSSGNFGFGGPISLYTDSVSGSVTFNNVIGGYYKISIGPSNSANNPQNNFDNTIVWLNIPTGSGTYNANNLIISSSTLPHP